MNIENFKQKFSDAIDDESVINMDASINFKELESWDSFSAMSIIAMIDQEFLVTINAKEMSEINTILELYTKIISKQNER